MEKGLSIPTKIFLAIELVLYLLFMGIDIVSCYPGISQDNIFYRLSEIPFFASSHLKYYGIMLCFIFSIFLFITKREKSKALLSAAMFFTLVSDFFLLLHPDIMIPGLITFIVAQSIYLYVITGGDMRKLAYSVAIRIGIAFLAAFILEHTGLIYPGYSRKDQIILFLGLLYAISFFGNVIRHACNIFSHKKAAKTGDVQNKPKCLFKYPVLFMIGLMLFVLCDINVLIFNLYRFMDISSSWYSTLYLISSVLMWAFYLPSQVLIVLSA